jgi:hypothetical protein
MHSTVTLNKGNTKILHKNKTDQILKLHRPSFSQRNIMCTVRNINLNVPILVPNLFICDSLRTLILLYGEWSVNLYFLLRRYLNDMINLFPFYVYV